MRSRRDMLKTGGAVAATFLGPGTMMGGSPATEEARETSQSAYVKPDLPEMRGFSQDQFNAELQELLTYRVRVRKAVKASSCASACSVPLSTFPLNVYVRLSAEQLEIPEPQIPGIHTAMCSGYLYSEQLLLPSLMTRLQLLPYNVEIVDTISLRYDEDTPVRPSRVVSPRYVVDIDEPDFSMRTTASMLLDSVDGIWREWNRNLRVARQVCESDGKQLGSAGTSRVESFQITPIKMMCKAEAFMLEVMAWNMGAGLVVA